MKNIDFTAVISSICSGVLGIILTHMFYSRKLEKERISKANSIVSQKKEKSTIEFLNLVSDIASIEIYDAEKVFGKKGYNVNFFEGEITYPTLMNDLRTYSKYMDRIRNLRENHEKYLSCKSSLYLLYIDRYMMQLDAFVRVNGGNKYISLWGTLFGIDINKWRIKAEKQLVKDINKHNYRLESSVSMKRVFLRKKIVEKEFNNSILNYVINPDGARINKKKEAYISMFLTWITNEIKKEQ